MEIRSLDHSALLVRNVELSRYFYGEVLGMEEVPRPSTFHFPGAWFRKGHAEIHIIGEEEPGRAAQLRPNNYHPNELATGHGPHFAFEIADIDAAQLHLQKHQIEIVGGPRPRGDGITQLYILDPDGYLIELFVR